ncbi:MULTISPECIES: response regulator transcription factor [Clostridium]|uniref:response regulator transcription factor n=1 Tax=Clostridium TaxID=1485 RepID=UPI001897A2F8|nr:MULTISPECIES: response regulator transcription factor [Clostridium]MCR1950839.1 response regulator transcription factor [Clostridium sp. DSM 100503]MDI9216572.1 response regulator transcription factor [Clostridium tertium]
MINILIVDDEKEIVDLIELYLRNKGYCIFKAYDSNEALKILNSKKINLIIMDLMMPDTDGYDLIRKIRSNSNLPIIIISAKCENHDKVIGLDIGADDYITKPFDPLELIARVNAQLRRCYLLNLDENKDNIIKSRDLILDKDKVNVTKGEKEISLTLKEFKLLELFMENKNKVLTKQRIFENVWNEEYLYDDNVIMVHISNLRDKIEDDNKENKYIKTIRGIGYRFEDK